MSLSGFHPAVAQWFSARFPDPTEPQRRAWPVIQSGRDVLIAAPTGSGKTFAAFLSAIDSLLRQGLDGTRGTTVRFCTSRPSRRCRTTFRKISQSHSPEFGRRSRDVSP
jgi:Lhr-like helicase